MGVAVEVDRAAQAQKLVRDRGRPRTVCGAVVEDDDARDDACELRRQPDVLAVAVRNEQL